MTLIQTRIDALMIRYFDVYEINEEVAHLIGTARDSIAINLSQPTEFPSPQKVFLGERGRPRYLIPREQI